MRRPFGSGLWGLLVLVASSDVLAGAADGEAWLETSREILESLSDDPPRDWLRTQPDATILDQVEAIAARKRSREAPTERPLERNGTVYVFASFSVPPETLRSLLTQATEPDVVVVLRGLAPGTTLKGTLARLRTLLPPTEDVANVILDPTLFRRFHIEIAPTLVLVRTPPAAPVTAVGAVTVRWLRERAQRLAETDEADLGIRGEAFPIAEVDLVEEMQRRMAAIDWPARREAAMRRFWERKRDFVNLPEATVDREFWVDPSVRVAEDIRDVNGHALARGGQSFNPLDVVPLSKTIVVFRGTDARHVAIAATVAEEARNRDRGVILLTTRIARDRGWQGLGELASTLRGPVYLLSATLAERFRLAHVPSVIEAGGNRLRVREVALGPAP